MLKRTEHISYINSVLVARLDRNTLMSIYKLCAPRAKFCLVGFNDYAKHIINLLPGTLEHIIDDDPRVNSLHYRDHIVVGSSVEIESICVVICKYEYLSEYTAKIKERYPEKTVVAPSSFEGESTRFANYYIHDSYHRYIFETEKSAPASMMAKDKIMLLCELLRSTSILEGVIGEFGVWQGGSTYFMMRACGFLKNEKKFLLFDLFEGLERKFKEAIMCDDEIERILSFYPNFELIKGDMNEKIEDFKNETFSFIHYDLGFHPKTLTYLYEHTVAGGIIVFDNYGFSTASPELYKKFFRQWGEEIISMPFSEQGVLFKRNRIKGVCDKS